MDWSFAFAFADPGLKKNKKRIWHFYTSLIDSIFFFVSFEFMSSGLLFCKCHLGNDFITGSVALSQHRRTSGFSTTIQIFTEGTKYHKCECEQVFVKCALQLAVNQFSLYSANWTKSPGVGGNYLWPKWGEKVILKNRWMDIKHVI